MADYDKLLQVPRGTKERLEQIKLDLLVNTLVYATDTKELGIKLSDGNIEYFKNAADINAIMTGKQDKLVAGDNITIDPDTNEISASGGEVDPNERAYFNFASSFYGDKYSLFANAWEHSLTVDTSEISANGAFFNYRGKAQYPNGETEGVIIPQGVTTIGNYAFGYWDSNNQPLVIPNSITSIGDSAFRDWKSNTHPLVIPDSVTIIGIYAFYDWSLVPYVEIRATTPPTLANQNAFDNQNNAPIYVPDESVTAYKTATNWVDLASRIFPISDKDNTYTKGEIDLMIGDIESALDAILGV